MHRKNHWLLISALVILQLIFAGCSVYRSAGRKAFEQAAPQRVGYKDLPAQKVSPNETQSGGSSSLASETSSENLLTSEMEERSPCLLVPLDGLQKFLKPHQEMVIKLKENQIVEICEVTSANEKI